MALDPSLFKASEHPIDLSSFDLSKEFLEWIQKNLKEAPKRHTDSTPTLRLWHINGSNNSYSKKQILLTFHETDRLTPTEVELLKNSKIAVTSKYTQSVFGAHGIDSAYVPLGFDSDHFRKTGKQYFPDRITFNLLGKFEKRKHHEKIIKSWVKKYGKNHKFALQCAIHNSFYGSDDELRLIYSNILNNQSIFNVHFLGRMPRNADYNDFLNSGDIVVGCSGGEGFGLPEFHSLALGKHGVILDAHAYKDWANNDNSILLPPSGKIEVYDNKFFRKDAPFNQGEIYDFSPDEFIDCCELAIKRVEHDRVNHAGLKLQSEFSYSKTAQNLLTLI